MVLTICSEGDGAVDLPFLFQMGPKESKRIPLSMGHLDVFFTESGPERYTFAMVLSPDPTKIVPETDQLTFNGPPIGYFLSVQPYTLNGLFALGIEEAFPTLLVPDTSPKHNTVHQITFDIGPMQLPDAPQWSRLWEALGYEVETTKIEGRNLFEFQMRGAHSIPELFSQLQILVALSDPFCTKNMTAETLQTMLQRAVNWLSSYKEAEWIAQQLQFPNPVPHRSFLHQLSPEKPLDGGLETTIGASSPQRDLAISSFLKEMACKKVLVMENVDAGLCWQLISEDSQLHITVASSSDHGFRKAANQFMAKADWTDKASQVAFLPSSAFHKDDQLKGFDIVIVPEILPELEKFRQKQLLRNLFEEIKPPCLVLSGTFRTAKEASSFSKLVQKNAQANTYGARTVEVPPPDVASGDSSLLAFLHPLSNA